MLWAVVACGGVDAVCAQTPPGDRPFRGLFGSDADIITAGKKGQLLDLTLATYTAFDQDERAEGAGRQDSARSSTPGGWFPGWSGQVLYLRQGNRVSFFAAGGTNQRYDHLLGRWANLTDQGSVGATAALSPRLHLRIAQGVTYSPYYHLGLTEQLRLDTDVFNQLDTESGEYTLLPRRSWTSTTDTSLVYEFSSRASLEARYDHRYTNFATEDLELRAQNGGVVVRYKTTPRAGFHAGYGYREGRYALAARPLPTLVHDLDLGADYERPLPFAQRATVAFSVGSTVVSTPATDSKFTVTGEGNLSVGFAESWKTMVGYYRGVDFVGGLAEPLFINGLSGRLSGFVSDRIDVTASGEYAFGTLGFRTPSNPYSNYTGSTRVRFALTRNVAIYATHLFYHYEFGATAELPSGLAQRFNRHGARAGLVLWVPFIRH